MINYDVDLVVTFVDNHDPIWRASFEGYCLKYGHRDRLIDVKEERYDNPGLFKYWFKCVNKFMPWARKIFLVVSNPEQVPNDIDMNKVHVVCHKDIIPEKFLPTFNSTTIEMFLHEIPGLAEHYIYFNDDMFPIGPLAKEDFFAEDGRIRINLRSCDIRNHRDNQFRKVCWNNYQHVGQALGVQVKAYDYLRPSHGATPMIRSHCHNCMELIGEKILVFATAFRTDKQHNQYIFPLWECFQYTVAPSSYSFIYSSLKLGSLVISGYITSGKYQMICINDVKIPNRNKFDFQAIKNAFEKILQ